MAKKSLKIQWEKHPSQEMYRTLCNGYASAWVPLNFALAMGMKFNA